jgi:hypothetical protein
MACCYVRMQRYEAMWRNGPDCVSIVFEDSALPAGASAAFTTSHGCTGSTQVRSITRLITPVPLHVHEGTVAETRGCPTVNTASRRYSHWVTMPLNTQPSSGAGKRVCTNGKPIHLRYTHTNACCSWFGADGCQSGTHALGSYIRKAAHKAYIA